MRDKENIHAEKMQKDLWILLKLNSPEHKKNIPTMKEWFFWNYKIELTEKKNFAQSNRPMLFFKTYLQLFKKMLALVALVIFNR